MPQSSRLPQVCTRKLGARLPRNHIWGFISGACSTMQFAAQYCAEAKCQCWLVHPGILYRTSSQQRYTLPPIHATNAASAVENLRCLLDVHFHLCFRLIIPVNGYLFAVCLVSFTMSMPGYILGSLIQTRLRPRSLRCPRRHHRQ